MAKPRRTRPRAGARHVRLHRATPAEVRWPKRLPGDRIRAARVDRDRGGVEWRVRGATGIPASPEGVEVASRRELDLSMHGSRQLTDPLLERSDLLLTMGPAHLEALLGTGGGPRSSTLGGVRRGARRSLRRRCRCPIRSAWASTSTSPRFRHLEAMVQQALARLAPMLGP